MDFGNGDGLLALVLFGVLSREGVNSSLEMGYWLWKVRRYINIIDIERCSLFVFFSFFLAR